MISNPERCTDLFVVMLKFEGGGWSKPIQTLFEFRYPYGKNGPSLIVNTYYDHGELYAVSYQTKQAALCLNLQIHCL